MKKRKQDYVTPLLKKLPWLPVKFCCQYKIMILAYRHFKGSLPPYLSSSLCTYKPSCSLQSSKEKFQIIPKQNLKSFWGNFLLVSWCLLFGTRYQLISEICQHYVSSHLTSKPFCSPRLSRRCSSPDCRLCICICFLLLLGCCFLLLLFFEVWRDACGQGGWKRGMRGQ